MLVQPDNSDRVDFNNDGYMELGQAKMFSFPPPNAPDDVKEAWDKTTASMSHLEVLRISSIFMNKSLDANQQTDENGRFTDYFTASDDEYVNIFPKEKDDWATLFNEIDEYLNDLEKINSVGRFDKEREVIHTFRDHLFG